ncbi:Gfo/Idh/MocA family oxidoreductase [Algoriphagus machipongonensis]|uniref:Oxidoreductase, NAD-binding n=1 Tax=Algoriphagus machipongonensis TaxID=388413 RepID=A3HVN2_9BACT|nr:Gfo/Idh/MocA family oxidoreductase [Algoriphagus machipongonensis]EAZ82204.1 oxidoreductase, NAD-binding [Algoriphagus machipongonensis]
MKSPIKTAIVGYGSVAEKMHAPLISVCSDLELIAVVERHQNKSQEKYPEVTIYRSLEELLEKSDVDLVVITTPNTHHFPMAKQCLLAGKHVVVDKPITIHSWEAEELKVLSEKVGKICTAFQNRRFDGDILTLQQLVEEETLGGLVYLESHFDRFRPDLSGNWREEVGAGNGITYDLGSHLIDQVYITFGAPDSIQADIRKQRTDAIVDDHFDITMDYGRFKARLTAGVLVNAPTPKYLLLGQNGSYQKFGMDVQEQAFKAGVQPAGDSWGVEPEENWGKIFLKDGTKPYPSIPGDYRIFYNNIADVLLRGASLKVTIQQAISVLKMIEASFLSASENRSIAREEGNW